MRSTQAVKMKSDLVQRGLEIAKERKLTHGQGVELAVLESNGVTFEEISNNQAPELAKAPTKGVTGEDNTEVTNGSQSMPLVSLDASTTQKKSISPDGDVTLEQRVNDLEKETLLNRQLGIVNARQHARSLFSQVGKKPLGTEEQLELFMSELAAIGVSQNVLETTQTVLQENGYKTLEMQPVTKPKALSTGGN